MKVNDIVYIPSIGKQKPITRTRITELWAGDDGPGYMVQGYGNTIFTEDMMATTVGELIEKHVNLRTILITEEA